MFDSASVNDEKTCQVIAEVKQATGKLLDPHTAIGVESARIVRRSQDVPMATLATAHPAKFGDAITAAGLDLPELPAHLADLFERDERYAVIANDLAQVTSYIKAHI
jgi:threonine synthase